MIVRLFISHIWENSYNAYARLVAMLTSVPAFQWNNVSITGSEAVTIWQEGENARRQRLELHQEAAKALAAQISKCYERLKELDRLDSLEQRIASHDEETKRRLEHMERQYAGEIMVEFEMRCAAEELTAMKKAFASIDMQSIVEERKQLYEFVLKLENEHSFQRQSIDGLESIQELQSWNEAPDADFARNADAFWNPALRFDGFGGKIPSGTVRHMNANLALVLHNRIAQCDVLVVLADMFSQYRRWCEFEFETAWNLRKPIVAVLPPYEGAFPREIVRRCGTLARWDANEVIAAIRSVACHYRKLCPHTRTL